MKKRLTEYNQDDANYVLCRMANVVNCMDVLIRKTVD